MKKRGFTLIEVIIVLAIIFIVVLLLVPLYGAFSKKDASTNESQPVTNGPLTTTQIGSGWITWNLIELKHRNKTYLLLERLNGGDSTMVKLDEVEAE